MVVVGFIGYVGEVDLALIGGFLRQPELVNFVSVSVIHTCASIQARRVKLTCILIG